MHRHSKHIKPNKHLPYDINLNPTTPTTTTTTTTTTATTTTSFTRKQAAHRKDPCAGNIHAQAQQTLETKQTFTLRRELRVFLFRVQGLGF